MGRSKSLNNKISLLLPPAFWLGVWQLGAFLVDRNVGGRGNELLLPYPATVARIAEILSTTADFLLGLYRPVSNVTTPEERFFGNYAESLIPVIGTVKAGYGALAFEEDYGQEYARVKDPSNYFYLVVRGDSMEPRIQDGDLALVHKQDTLENGDLGVLVYGDEGEGTLKRYIQRGNCVVLQPFNPAYNELVIKGEDLNRLHIAGRVVETKAKW